MGVNRLFHKKYARHVAKYHYPNTVRIQSSTITFDTSNEPTIVWADVSSLIGLTAYIEPFDGTEEIRKPDQTIITNGFHITIAGAYNITEGQRAIDELENTYNIITASNDSFNQQTNLICEIVNIAINT